MKEDIQLREHNKQEFPPMHTAEHILNQTMVRMFGCKRSQHTHIERKKSKLDYELPVAPSPIQIKEIESRVNEIIESNLPVVMEYMNKEEAAQLYDLDKLPESSSQTLRIVRIGDYDACPCIGVHVTKTSEIGHFYISSTRYTDGIFRIVFRLN